MTTNYHTVIATGAAANASTFNAPLGQLDAQLTTTQAEITAARDAYASLGARLDGFTLAGSNVSTLTNGAASAGQKIVDVDSTTGFVAGAYVAYMLVGGAVEYNTINAVTSSTRLTLTTNIGTGGIANDTYLAMISPSEVAAANAINHDDDLTLSNTIGYVSRDAYYPEAYGAVGDGVTDDTAAWQAMIVAIKARSVATSKQAIVLCRSGANYLITDSLNLCNLADVVIDGTSMETRITYADTNATVTDRVLFDCVGSGWLTFRNLSLIGDGTNKPAVAISLGRSTTNGNAGENMIERVYITGAWTHAAIYAISAELTTIRALWVSTTSADSNTTYGIYTSTKDDLSVGSAVERAATESAACQWISHCNVGGDSGLDSFVPVYFHNVGNASLRDSYIYTFNDEPAIKIAGNAVTVIIDNVTVEGETDKTIHVAAYSGAGTVNGLTIKSTSLGVYANVGIYSDAGTTIRGLVVENVGGVKTGGASSNITFAGDIHNSQIGRWWSINDGAVTLANLYNSQLHVSSHTVSASSVSGSLILRDATGGDQSWHLSAGLRVGTLATTNLAEINDIRTASDNWSPGEIANGGNAKKYVGIAGVTQAAEWFCLAHYAGINGYAGWDISAVAGDGAIGVSIVNRTGGAVTPTGTLHVMAMKVTAA